MCKLLKQKVETSAEGNPGKKILSKYLCPCGIVDVTSIKMEKHDAHTVHIKSEKCGI